MHADDAPDASRPSRTRRALRVLALGYALVLVVGGARYAAVAGPEWTPALDVPAAERRVSALASHGGRVRASSYAMRKVRHPMFLIDGEATSGGPDFWYPAEHDEAPWVEVQLGRTGDVAAVELTLLVNAPRRQRYTVQCVRRGVPVGDPVEGPPARERGPKVRHALGCAGVDGVRVAFDRTQADSARLRPRPELFELTVVAGLSPEAAEAAENLP